MNSKRLRMILISLICLCGILFIAVCVLGLSKLQQKSQEVVGLKLQNRTIEAQLANFAQAKVDVEKYGYFKQVAKTVIPNDKDQAQAVLDIFKLADQSGIALQSVNFAASTLGAKPVAGTDSATSSATTKAALSQAKPVEGIKGLYSLELTITPDLGNGVPDSKKATYKKLLDFLDRIQRNRRTSQISQVMVQPQTESGNNQYINFNLVTSIFIKP